MMTAIDQNSDEFAKLVERYTQQLSALLPPGDALNTDDGGELREVLRRMADPLALVDALLTDMPTETDPRTASQLMAEWEDALQLPDSCSIGGQTLAERQAAAFAKYTDSGGARIPRYIALANALGYDAASTVRYTMTTCEDDGETPLYEQVDRFRWSLQVGDGTTGRDSTVIDDCETPLQTWGDAVLECIFYREAPAMSEVNFIYA
ncbi:hypothetical protein DTO96_102535 [Ephemeroptericola cinctiostellae]|uniref:Phage tail protein n=1 Tax=Ephemeroptericola cinctiostellae TaxID=2268024 RepID=A0A345DEJ1_9BURK|nr:putative phage tail protein [Ephemeroptericola cinctiostellae]AXF86779.1 hypothetical protein DTO96_102535 [Ephemeroptericola cinctiostellae]